MPAIKLIELTKTLKTFPQSRLTHEPSADTPPELLMGDWRHYQKRMHLRAVKFQLELLENQRCDDCNFIFCKVHPGAFVHTAAKANYWIYSAW